MSQCFLSDDDYNEQCVCFRQERHKWKWWESSFLFKKLWIRPQRSDSATFHYVNRAYLLMLYILYIVYALFLLHFNFSKQNFSNQFCLFFLKFMLLKTFSKISEYRSNLIVTDILKCYGHAVMWHIWHSYHTFILSLPLAPLANVKTLISFFYSGQFLEVMVQIFVILYSFFFLSYHIFYFCIVCSVILSLLVCHCNVAARVENWTSLKLVMHSSKASEFHILLPLW